MGIFHGDITNVTLGMKRSYIPMYGNLKGGDYVLNSFNKKEDALFWDQKKKCCVCFPSPSELRKSSPTQQPQTTNSPWFFWFCARATPCHGCPSMVFSPWKISCTSTRTPSRWWCPNGPTTWPETATPRGPCATWSPVSWWRPAQRECWFFGRNLEKGVLQPPKK